MSDNKLIEEARKHLHYPGSPVDSWCMRCADDWPCVTRRLTDALEAATRERDAALARIAELEADRDKWRRLFSECHPVHLDGVERAHRAEARIAEAAKLHQPEVLGVHEGYGEEIWCPHCEKHWPCDDAKALGPNEGENE